ncbi:tripartite tricarboxylate transporter substrate binding protein [Noviherbaspirillum suwonense]|uniref:Tripartite-type tricarboxylate transporter, receptor component TctC n=1 Tax=Noviherbaspirillum suwonense TaxID=1224511 RepID=A0ABY1QS19_9BURK|nr:tripartite tricarboxylate transporter substrate binding protein [Noviherbaspirillum suwonense]SMP77307.1 Tripartite-type tricarboxylate transporter, receptor component TctC [Noviherbaspirillum suwonense]
MQTKRPTLRRAAVTLSIAAAGIAAASMPALAQDNARPIRIVVGAPAGGTTDTLARAVGRGMEVSLKRPVIVENRGGAGGNIAAEMVARSAPNGETILMSFTSHTINASLYPKLPFDPIKDFTPITMVATVPSVLIANHNVPANTLAELLDHAKKHPGALNFAIGGSGSSLHLAGEQLKMMTGANIVNVAYKGTNPAVTDVLAGHVELMFASALNVLPHLQGGKIKLLGVTSATPMPQFPNVPPIGKTVKGFESNAWFGLFGPAKMPAEVTQRLYEAAKKAIEDPAFVKKLETDGGTPSAMPPQQFGEFVVRDVQHWAKVVKFSGAVAE